MSPFRRRHRSGTESAPPLTRRPNAGLLRRERRGLVAARAQRVLDLGGLAVEMYSYGAWRSDLLEERCAEIVGIDTRIADIDVLLGRRPATPRCGCGANLRPEAQFCSNCGRSVVPPAEHTGPDDTIVARRRTRGG